MSVFVALHGVTKTYGPVRALVGVRARFEAGQVSMVEGANGSGKSTLLSIAGALTKPTMGRVEHGGVGQTREEVRASLGWVGHDTLCYGELTGRENVELAARLHDVDVARAWSTVKERFELAAFADRPVRTYSRGQRQRVALARALVGEPKFVLLDEPTAGLDKRATERLARVVREEADRGAVVIVVTHDAAFADLGDFRLRLDRGRIVE